jgi:hypothetical protein
MFRSQSKSKSLKIQRETVRVLAGSQLASAQGGGPFVFDGPVIIITGGNNSACLADCLGGGVSGGPSMSAPGSCPPGGGPSIIVNPFPSLREP